VAEPLRITNCHVHTFTHAHVPSRFVRPPLGWALRAAWFRKGLFAIVRRFDRGRRGRIARLARILELGEGTQEAVFARVRSYYPRQTRFVVLPMHMQHMGCGPVDEPIDVQHDQLRLLRDQHVDTLLPFAAVDPRQPYVVEKTTKLLSEHGFRGIKLYPPIGYHPYDERLHPLYAYCAEHGHPVMTHCSRPAQVKYRGKPTAEMRVHPVTGETLDWPLDRLLTMFTDPHSYIPVLTRFPTLRVCLAHFGGHADWQQYVRNPWDVGSDPDKQSWLGRITDMLRSGDYQNLYTDISYTVFADLDNVHLLKVLLADERISNRVLFGSDYYVVENAKHEERQIALRIRSILGEQLYKTIAQDNPTKYLGV